MASAIVSALSKVKQTSSIFETLRYRLLLSYLAVLASILLIFALAVRIAFTKSLMQKQTEELMLLARAAATTADFTGGQITLGDAFAASKLTARNEALQWFNAEGELIGQSGLETVSMPIDFKQPVQVQSHIGSYGHTVLAVTLLIVNQNNQRITGFVRASHSLESINASLTRLDWGLGTGIAIAILCSSAGGIWLTRQSMKPIEESFERLRQFTADASHELRNPLMAIKSNTQVALKYPEGMRPGDHEKLQAIASATQQMTQLTEDLLFLARTDRPPQQKKEPINLSELLEALMRLFESQASAQGVSLSGQLTPGLILQGDRAQLQRLFTNLIVNAMQYTPSGGSIQVLAERTAKQITVTVKDTGIGIRADQLHKIFDRFWRSEQSRSYADGSGLGLAIVQAIALNHSGQISVTSEEGKGSSFTVLLAAGKSTSGLAKSRKD
jgi:two-component system, OmpR family, manganese sensing sensor histidine kinase